MKRPDPATSDHGPDDHGPDDLGRRIRNVEIMVLTVIAMISSLIMAIVLR